MFLVRLVEYLDSVFSGVTGPAVDLWCKVTGTSNFVLAAVLVVVSWGVAVVWAVLSREELRFLEPEQFNPLRFAWILIILASTATFLVRIDLIRKLYERYFTSGVMPRTP